MTKIEVFDPPMCCSTGVCGPSVNTELIEFQSTLTYLKNNGIEVERFNLGHDAAAFMKHLEVVEAMGPGAEHLPVIVVNGKIQSKGKYPSREEILNWVGLNSENVSLPSRNRLKVVK